jgi:hypothetical protein
VLERRKPHLAVCQEGLTDDHHQERAHDHRDRHTVQKAGWVPSWVAVTIRTVSA